LSLATVAVETASVGVDLVDQSSHDGTHVGADEVVETAAECDEVVAQQRRAPFRGVNADRQRLYSACELRRLSTT